MALSFTVNKAPISPDLKDACGLPWACVLQPFSPLGAQDEVRRQCRAEQSRAAHQAVPGCSS